MYTSLVKIIGSNVKDYFEGNTNTTKNYDIADGFSIANDGDTDLTFTVNGFTIRVKAGEIFDGNFDPFKTLTITTNGNTFRAIVRG